MSHLKVAILLPPEEPGNSADRADTFVQAAEIENCLTILGNGALTITFGSDRAQTARDLVDARPDLVVNLVEDMPEGPDYLHLATALLDSFGFPYTGARSATLKALGDKRDMKAALRLGGLPVAAGLDDGDPAGRYIVKSAIEHASIGIDARSVVTGPDFARALIALRQAQRGGDWFAEAFIDGREFNVGILATSNGPLVLPIAEILFLDHADRLKIVGYEEKWTAGSAAYAATPRHFSTDPADAALRDELARLALTAWQLFGLTGYARVDFRVDDRGAPYILEVNANPCLAADAGFCAAAAELGLSQTDVIAHLIETALA